ncbi:MAG: DUF192 domain-containing protein [Paracoccaceae bacterium]
MVMLSASPALAEACRHDVVQLRSSGSELRFQVELADTPQTRSRGLMFRESMSPRAGMLFVYEQPQRASFWMKNTLIPLDMIFVDPTGTVTHVHHQAIPGDLTPIEGGTGVLSVLEINGGLAKKYGIAPGSVLRHEIFSEGPAAWPC